MAIATYASGEVIAGCLDSLHQSSGAALRVVIVDNASPDETCAAVRKWADANLSADEFTEASVAERLMSKARLTLLHNDANRGFAHASNRAMELLLHDERLDMFWLLNPDCRVEQDTARYFSEKADTGPFALMGGRIVFEDRPNLIQTDGGRVSPLTARCISINWNRARAETAPPDAASLDYVSGASCIASRAFIESAGLMPEGYFLYYEEVDWAMRKGALPLVVEPRAIVRHIGGTSTGSARRTGPSSAFATWFNFRSRFSFIRRRMPWAWPLSAAWSLAKAATMAARGRLDLSRAILSGSFGGGPVPEVRERLDARAHKVLERF